MMKLVLVTERDIRRLTCIASDVLYRVRTQGQDNVINISTGSGVRRMIIKIQLYMYLYKSEHRFLNENLLTGNACARTHSISLVVLKRLPV